MTKYDGGYLQDISIIIKFILHFVKKRLITDTERQTLVFTLFVEGSGKGL